MSDSHYIRILSLIRRTILFPTDLLEELVLTVFRRSQSQFECLLRFNATFFLISAVLAPLVIALRGHFGYHMNVFCLQMIVFALICKTRHCIFVWIAHGLAVSLFYVTVTNAVFSYQKLFKDDGISDDVVKNLLFFIYDLILCIMTGGSVLLADVKKDEMRREDNPEF